MTALTITATYGVVIGGLLIGDPDYLAGVEIEFTEEEAAANVTARRMVVKDAVRELCEDEDVLWFIESLDDVRVYEQGGLYLLTRGAVS